MRDYKLFGRMPGDVKKLGRVARRELRQTLRRDFWQARLRGLSEQNATGDAKAGQTPTEGQTSPVRKDV